MAEDSQSTSTKWDQLTVRTLTLTTILRMCAKYGFEKPNDRRALDLMNACAKTVVTELSDITIGYGISDEYRCIFTLSH
jgi:tRNA(His) 5'-end guanylyltransferase